MAMPSIATMPIEAEAELEGRKADQALNPDAAAVKRDVDAGHVSGDEAVWSEDKASGNDTMQQEKEAQRSQDPSDDVLPPGATIPTDEEREALRKVAAKMPVGAFYVVVVEFAERFAYFGCVSGPFQNYVQNPLPDGSTTGAPVAGSPQEVAGALNEGQRTATALTTFFSFFCYLTPILGAVIADSRWGRYRTICFFTGIYFIGLIILTVTATPAGIANNAAFGGYIASILIVGLGTGGIKSNVAPLIADQVSLKRQIVQTLPSGERVIIDPNVTIQRLCNIFYWCINIGGLSSIATTNIERRVGFWLAFGFPTMVFLIVPLTLALGRTKYRRVPPRGSVIFEAFRICRVAVGQAMSWNPRTMARRLSDKTESVWDAARPSYVLAHGTKRTEAGTRPGWMTWDDTFVDEVKRAVDACKVFAFFPLYWICYNQMTNNLVSQAGSMALHGVPNDLFTNFDPIALIILIPLMDRLIYPMLRKLNIPFPPIKRIFFGFMLGSISMVYAAVLQHFIYKKNPCLGRGGDDCGYADINVWIQVPAYVLIAASEIFASITGLEYAHTKAPARMKSLVQALFLLTTAIANAIGEGLVGVSTDPYLVGNYAGVSIACFIAGCIFFVLFRHRDQDEEKSNEIGRVKRD